MIPRLLKLAFVAALLPAPFAANATDSGRTAPVFQSWTSDCSNTGACFASSFTRSQSAWVDLRVLRDWQADAQPLIRLTTNVELPKTGTISFAVDGKDIEALPLEQLRESQTAIVPPPGFRPLGGEGFWYPAGPASLAFLKALRTGTDLAITFPSAKGADPIHITLPLSGLEEALAWTDKRQKRTGTASALVDPGSLPAKPAPYAEALLGPDQLPPQITAIWAANRLCTPIEPAAFSGFNAVRAPLDDGGSLYVVPCGIPTAYNSPYAAVLVAKDGSARQIHLARMSEKGPIATALAYNARWIPSEQQLISYFKASGIGECGQWNKWQWNGTGLVLLEEATRTTCDGTAADLSNWSSTWPIKNSSN